MGFLQNCSINNETTSHCIAHAWSDPENEYLSKACCSQSCHESMCKQCDLLFETLNSILSITATLDSIEKADVQYDATLANNNIFNWLQHIICYAQQDKAKQVCLERLSNQTGLLIQDCCQNVFPNLKSSYVNLIMQVLILAVSIHNHFMRYANLMKFFFCTLITINLKRAKI